VYGRYDFHSMVLLWFLLIMLCAPARATPPGAQNGVGEATVRRTLQVGITLTALRDVDDVHGTFFADFYLSAYWQEAGCATLAGSAESRIVDVAEAWKAVQNPYIEFVNSYGREETRLQGNDEILVHSNGMCTYTFRCS